MSEKTERRTYVRHPLTLFVDTVQFNPEVYSGDEVRTAYDIELNEYEILLIQKQLKLHIDANLHPIPPVRIRVIGRLV